MIPEAQREQRWRQLRSECVQDLEEAKRQEHDGWIETLRTRKAWLDGKLAKYEPDGCLVVEAST